MSSRQIRRSNLLRHALLAILALGLTAPASADVGRYFKDRVNDFTDIFRLRAGVPIGGKGYGAKARVTALAQVGYVHFDGHYSGMDRRGIGTVREQRTEGGVSLLYFSRHRMEKVAGNEFLDTETLWSQVEDRRLIRNLPYWDDGRRDLLSVGAEIATPVLALDVAVNPSEAVDFVVGFFTIDPFRDDVCGLYRREEQRFRTPTTDPYPDMDAPTRELRERLEAEQDERDRIRIERLRELEERREAEVDAYQALETRRVPAAPRSEYDRVLQDEGELGAGQLDAVDADGERVEFVAPGSDVLEESHDENDEE